MFDDACEYESKNVVSASRTYTTAAPDCTDSTAAVPAACWVVCTTGQHREMFQQVAASVTRYPTTSGENAWRSIRGNNISTYLCPSDMGAETACTAAGGGWAPGNYGVNATVSLRPQRYGTAALSRWVARRPKACFVAPVAIAPAQSEAGRPPGGLAR